MSQTNSPASAELVRLVGTEAQAPTQPDAAEVLDTTQPTAPTPDTPEDAPAAVDTRQENGEDAEVTEPRQSATEVDCASEPCAVIPASGERAATPCAELHEAGLDTEVREVEVQPADVQDHKRARNEDEAETVSLWTNATPAQQDEPTVSETKRARTESPQATHASQTPNDLEAGRTSNSSVSEAGTPTPPITEVELGPTKTGESIQTDCKEEEITEA